MILMRLILSPFKEKVNLLAKQKALSVSCTHKPCRCSTQTEGNNKKAEFH